jgi:hypothetical protein
LTEICTKSANLLDKSREQNALKLKLNFLSETKSGLVHQKAMLSKFIQGV